MGKLQKRIFSCKEWELVHQFTKQLCEPDNVEAISSDIVDAICQSCLVRAHYQSGPSYSITLVESLSANIKAIPETYHKEDSYGLPVIPFLSHYNLKAEQIPLSVR